MFLQRNGNFHRDYCDSHPGDSKNLVLLGTEIWSDDELGIWILTGDNKHILIVDGEISWKTNDMEIRESFNN